MAANLFRVHGRALHHQKCMDPLPKDRIWNAYYGCLDDAGHRGTSGFHFRSIDLESAPVYHVFLAIDNVHVAGHVDVAQIS